MNTFTNLADARARLEESGGWLLDMGDGVYVVTDDEGLVRDMRGPGYIARCEAAGVWDETRAAPAGKVPNAYTTYQARGNREDLA